MAEQYVYFYLPEDYETEDENTDIHDTEQRPQRTGRIHTLGDIASSPSTHTPATDTTNSEETRASEQERQFAEQYRRINEQLDRRNEQLRRMNERMAAKRFIMGVFDGNADKVAATDNEMDKDDVDPHNTQRPEKHKSRISIFDDIEMTPAKHLPATDPAPSTLTRALHQRQFIDDNITVRLGQLRPSTDDVRSVVSDSMRQLSEGIKRSIDERAQKIADLVVEGLRKKLPAGYFDKQASK
ncbi:hypothetical protein LTR27_004748 [Elasticomyces elasticus]|nr:hypothetical protein LTR27_004748 [Elasticomyces elasticus]